MLPVEKYEAPRLEQVVTLNVGLMECLHYKRDGNGFSCTAVSRIVEVANKRAEEIAGVAYSAMYWAKEFAETAKAMKNIIEGYGDA